MSLEKIKSIDNNTKFKLIAQGNTAEVYLYDNNKILKLFRENLPIEPITAEYEKVKCIQLKHHNVPKVYEIIRYRERYGIIYEKIIGTDMINNMLRNIFNLKRYSKLLARIHFELHRTELELNSSVKSKLSMEINSVSILSEEEKGRITHYLQNLPDGNALLHFDFHPGNIIMQSNEPIIIDWMTACTGNPNADVARTYLLLQYGELQQANWVVKKIAHFFEGYIGKIYISEYKHFSGISDEDFEQWLLPVAAARLMEWISDNEKEQLLRFIRKELSELQVKSSV